MKNKRSSGAMWNLIEEMGWNMKANPKFISQRFFRKWGTLLIGQVHDFAAARVAELQGTVNDYEHQTDRKLSLGSDDAMNDLLWHIVGMGHFAWLTATSNPTILEIRAKNSNYKESFEYCFHKPEPNPIEESNSLMSHLAKHLPLTTSVPFKLFGTSYAQVGNAANTCICLMPCETEEQREVIQYLLNCWNSQPGIVFPSKN